METDRRATPAHEATCKDCDQKLHILWDAESMMWVADGDLIVLGCENLGDTTSIAGLQ
jgi:hypothetical protein